MSQSFSRYPKIFPAFYIGMIRSGEVSGNLPQILKTISKYLEKEYHFRSKIVGAMIYPVIVFSAAIVIFVFLMVFVIPKLADTLLEVNENLPPITVAVIDISNFFRHWWWILFLGTIALCFSFYYYFFKTKDGREFFDRFSLRVPIFGNFLKNRNIIRFTEGFSALISSGIPIAQSLEITAGSIDNSLYKKIILLARDGVLRGKNLDSVFEEFPTYLPSLLTQMTNVGEKTGRLDVALRGVARFYQEEADVFINSFSSLIEPLMIIFLGLVVGLIAASVFLPLYQLGA